MMSTATHDTEKRGVGISTRVRVELGDGTFDEGIVVDDFGDLIDVETGLDVRLRRWAINTDAHGLVFADSVDPIE